MLDSCACIYKRSRSQDSTGNHLQCGCPLAENRSERGGVSDRKRKNRRRTEVSPTAASFLSIDVCLEREDRVHAECELVTAGFKQSCHVWVGCD